MGEFIRNPAFMPYLEQAVLRGMEDVLRDTESDVRRNLAPASIIRKTPIKRDRASRFGGGDIGGRVSYGRGLGPIYERGTTERFTRRGASRGRITTANYAMQNARESAIRRGLDLSRYL